MRMARAVGALGIGIESSIGSRDDLSPPARRRSIRASPRSSTRCSASTPGQRDGRARRRLSPHDAAPAAPAALILADGAVPDRAVLDAAWPGWDDGHRAGRRRRRRRASRGRARPADRPLGRRRRLDRCPPSWPCLAEAGVEIGRAATDKDESDTELALLAAVDAGADGVTILGGLGGARVDHALANVGAAGAPGLDGRAARLYDERAARISLLAGPAVAGGRSIATSRDGPATSSRSSRSA